MRSTSSDTAALPGSAVVGRRPPIRSYWKLRVPSSAACLTCPVQCLLEIRPYDGYVACEAAHGCEKVAEQDEDSIQLDQETNQWPS